MFTRLADDRERLERLLRAIADHAAAQVQQQRTQPVAHAPASAPSPASSQSSALGPLAPAGIGAEGAWQVFREQVAPRLSASPGPRYFGFVTGGVTPAALVGDWLTSLFDQNAVSRLDGSMALDVERATLRMLADLFDLPQEFSGTFTSGATMSNMVGLAIGREWIGREWGHEVAVHRQGLAALGRTPTVLAATPHSTAVKALSMLGFGRDAWQAVGCLPQREAMDVNALATRLAAATDPVIVIASAGTVNTGDFDDFVAIAELKRRHRFYLHVDAAFGGFAQLSPDLRPLISGWTCADSICIDLHKWLNVPYDSAVVFTRHRRLQLDVFANTAAYLTLDVDDPEPVHLAPESSHRWRALPAWFTLTAYGREGHREIVERDCRLARMLGERLTTSEHFDVLAPVRLNVVAFALRQRPGRPGEAAPAAQDGLAAATAAFIARVRDSGDTFVSPTQLWGRPAVRAAFSNWQTTEADVDRTFNALVAAAETL